MSTKTMKAIVQSQYGGPQTMKIGEVPFPTNLKDGECIVKIAYTTVNRADTIQRKGKYNPPPNSTPVIGLQYLGYVCDQNGNCDVSQQSKTAKPVMGILSGGGYGQYAVTHKSHLLNVPKSMELDRAAAIPQVWMTAYQLINKVGGGLKPGQYVLIHGAASGVGTSLIQLAKLAGAKPIAVASTKIKLDFCKEMGAVAGINYKEDLDFGDKIMEITGGQGAHMILDCVCGGPNWVQNEKSIAKDGVWVIYGLLGGGVGNGVSFGRLLMKRVRIEFSLLRPRDISYKAQLTQKLNDQIIPLFENGTLQPVIHCFSKLSQVVSAHQLMQSNTTIGKIVLENDL